MNKKSTPCKDATEKGGTKSCPKAEAPSIFGSPKKPLTPPKKPVGEPQTSKPISPLKASPAKKLLSPVKITKNVS